MTSKYAFLFLVLQPIQLCLAQNTKTVIDVKTDLQTDQSFTPEHYSKTADLIPANGKVPDEIRNATTLGVWLFPQTSKPLITLTSKHAFKSISLKIFNSVGVKVTFEDKATEAEASEPVSVPANNGDLEKVWAEREFEFKRTNVSDEEFTLKFDFDGGKKEDLILIDSIIITNSISGDSGTPVISPTVIIFTVLMAMALKKFM